MGLRSYVLGFGRASVMDDFVNRLNFIGTPIMFLGAFLVSMCLQIFVSPIECWGPAQFTDGWEEYTEKYCLLDNSYYLPVAQVIPMDFSERRQRQIAYYKWTPYLFLLLAMVAFLPYVAARFFQPNMKKKRSKDSESGMFDAIPFLTRFKGVLQVILKFFGLGVLLLEFLVVVRLLGGSGFAVADDLIKGHVPQTSNYFPLVTMCDFEVRVLGNVHHHTVQCTLSINEYYMKKFVAMYFWLFFMLIITVLNIIYWILISIFMIFVPQQRRYRGPGRQSMGGPSAPLLTQQHSIQGNKV